MFRILKTFKHRKLITVNQLVNKSKGLTIGNVSEYVKELSQKPKREDFIPYDKIGKIIKDHKPLFKGWFMDPQTSGDEFKTAKLIEGDKTYVLYFDTADGVTLVSQEHVVDHCTYNELAIYFMGELKLN